MVHVTLRNGHKASLPTPVYPFSFPVSFVLPGRGQCIGKPPPSCQAPMRHSETLGGVIYTRSEVFGDNFMNIPLFWEPEGTFYCISPANGGLIPMGIVTGAFPGPCNGG